MKAVERKKMAQILVNAMTDEELAEMLKVRLDKESPEKTEFIATMQKSLGRKRFAKIQSAIGLSVEDYAEVTIQRFEPKQLEELIASLQKQLGKTTDN